MTDDKGNFEARDWAGAVDEVLDRVAAHEAAVEEVAERQKPRSRLPWLVAALAVLLGVAAWDVWLLSRPPEGLPDVVVLEDLRYEVQLVAEVVEDFRAEEGRLPQAAEIAEYLDEDLEYRSDGTSYVLIARDGDLSAVYDGSVPLAEWVAGTGGRP